MLLKQWIEKNRKYFTESDLQYLIASSQEEKFLNRALRQYRKGLPMAYILGKEEFFGRSFKINKTVLAPRPETEIIAETAINLARKENLKKILDLGTGSGIIALTLKKALGYKINLIASDISSKALKVAKANAKKHRVKIKFIRSNFFNSLAGNKFDMIVTNPPYVASCDIIGSLRFEPKLSLDGGADGLKLITKLLSKANKYLKNGGYLVIEMGYNQKKPVKDLVDKTSYYDIIEWIKDYSRHWRGVILRKKR